MKTVYSLLCLPLLSQCTIVFPTDYGTTAPPCSAQWSQWSPCSVTCGLGQQQRTINREGKGRGCYNLKSYDVQNRLCEGPECIYYVNITIPDTGCTKPRVRKNVRSLSTTEIRKLQNAMRSSLNTAIRWWNYQDVAHYHGAPNTGSDALCGEGNICCPHGSSQFLPWHRLLMANMEELLGEPLPYWDWTEDDDVPDIFETISVPFKNSESVAFDQFCDGTNRTFHRRGRDIDTQAEDLKRSVALAFESETYDQFWRRIEQPHNALHVRMGCDMAFALTAAYDPVFYLHHANVDRQFAFWQELQRIRRDRGEIDTEIDVSDLQTALQPFNNETVNPYETTRKNSLGEDSLDYRTNLCYEYDSLTHNGMTPEEYLNPDYDFTGGVRPPPGVLSNERPSGFLPSFRYFVGVILPKTGPSSTVEFSVCISGSSCQLSVCKTSLSCQAAGSVSTFGLSPRSRSGVSQPVSKNNYYISEYEVTNLNIEDWTQAQVQVTSGQEVTPVAPVIIRRDLGSHLEGGEVILYPGFDRKMYGDLLENFPSVVSIS